MPTARLQPTIELRRELTRIIRQLKPDRVITGDPTAVLYGDEYINHPDHRAAAEAALYAVFPSAVTRPIFPELLAEGLRAAPGQGGLYLRHDERRTLYIDISEHAGSQDRGAALPQKPARSWRRQVDSRVGRRDRQGRWPGVRRRRSA